MYGEQSLCVDVHVLNDIFWRLIKRVQCLWLSKLITIASYAFALYTLLVVILSISLLIFHWYWYYKVVFIIILKLLYIDDEVW